MIVKSFVLFSVLFALSVEGSEHGYTFDRQTDGWFKFHLTPKNWNDASAQCKLEGATLASPLTDDLHGAIRRVMVATGDKVDYTFFTGIYTNFSDDNLHSIEGEKVSKSNLPVVLEKQDCVVWVTGNYSLRKVECTEKLPYVCYKNVSIPRCGKDYSYDQLTYSYRKVGGSCYKFHRQGLTWDGANTKCQEEGAHLAVADNYEEIWVLRNIYGTYPNSVIVGDTKRNVIFVGIRNRLDGKSWMTVDGKRLAETSFEWASAEPNNMRGDEHCGTFGRQGKLYDDSCQLILPYICEKTPTVEIISPIPSDKKVDDSNAVANVNLNTKRMA